MADQSPPTSDNDVFPDLDEELIEIGDAVNLTEGTSSRSGTEDKRYKYQ
ncbi:albusnodin family lasso peptide [Nocardiopsis aegyptia]|uniref:Albusnodin family lasso peptide n=1 Tax=Nocardiopsis aegyptia TaxID=220378 RepID=A0A7Z0EJ30_9ACTN|nr:albusnodin family lasso peptide [Nocardiopsis aegyptia]NYJ33035.1 hypothetical protein [Nocardiopsis aegyptia]